MCHDCNNDWSVHEDNVILSAACQLQQYGYHVELKKYMGETISGKCYCDMAILHEGKTIGLVEFKNRKYHKEIGICDCEKTNNKQLLKYCQLGIPIFTCNGYEQIPYLFHWVANIVDNSMYEHTNHT